MLLSACSDVGLWLANRPNDFANATITRDVAYGDASRQRMDIYRPKGAQDAPALLFFYGGGWTAGNKRAYGFIADRFIRRGMAVAIADYRLYPEVTFPAFAEDAAAATAWLLDHADGYGINPAKVFVMGHSAGAYNGAMMLADARYLAAHGRSPDAVAGFIGLAGPYAFTPSEDKYQAIFNRMRDYAPMQVPSHIDGARPPMLLLHGGSDGTVYARNSELLAKALEQHHSPVTLMIYEGMGHLGIVAGLTRWLENEKLVGDIEAFLADMP